MGEWFSNGVPVDHLPVTDRGLQYGDGLFETIAIRKGEPRLWSLHCSRLAKGCGTLAIRMPGEDELSNGVAHAVAAGSVSAVYCIVKIIVTAGTGKRGYGRAKCNSPTILFGAFGARPPAAAYYRNGIETTICQTRLAMHSPTAGLKTLNRMEQVLAQSELAENGLFEGLTLNTDGHVICGTMSNVFFVRGQSISTPPVDACGVAGVMREHVMACLSGSGAHVRVENMPASELAQVDEVFLTNSQFGVIPVASCDTTRWGVGDKTRNLMVTMADAGIIECRP